MIDRLICIFIHLQKNFHIVEINCDLQSETIKVNILCN